MEQVEVEVEVRPRHPACEKLQLRSRAARAHLLLCAGHLTPTVTAIGRILDDLLGLAGLS